ncbi:toxin-antitoxin system YwqK family antitoxin [Fundidesulfovibrio agrisoli]|uniref:toxin-antitoxin system YwqK family antitoxin n=1 Tax=Fundidesulfovibrio agrisoli TaxID=2922717 RepID=UPI001FAC1983|nr:hypothetical protein [Fundidesulfovibrio agrisoli]
MLTAGARVPVRGSAQATIGSQGGSLRAGKALVGFPAGAVPDGTAVFLKWVKPTAVFGTSTPRDAYALDIGAAPPAGPLTVRVSSYGGADRDVKVALSESLTYSSSQRYSNRPRLVTGQVRAGTLSFQIPAPDLSASAATRGEAPALPLAPPALSWTGYVFTLVSGVPVYQSEHFELFYQAAPGEDATVPGAILAAAEKAFTTLTDYGFRFSSELNMPIGLYAQNGLGGAYGECVTPLSGKANQYITLNYAFCKPDKMVDLAATIGHEFFHIVQTIYDPRGSFGLNDLLATANFQWLMDASSVWFESKMVTNPNFVSSVFLENTDRVQRGLQSFTSFSDAQSMGYWASGFIHELVDASDTRLLLGIWNAVKAQGTSQFGYSDMDALFTGVGSVELTAQRWKAFAGKFLSGTTGRPGWPPTDSYAVPVGNRWHSYSGQALTEISKDLQPFSAQRWDFYFTDIDSSNDTWTFNLLTTTPSVEVSLYKAAAINGPYSLLANLSSDQPLQVTVASGDVLAVIAANADTTPPYTSTTNVRLRMAKEKQACPFCEGVPDNAVRGTNVWFSPPGSDITWSDPASGTLLARQVYADTMLYSLKSVYCYYPAAGNLRKYLTFDWDGITGQYFYDQAGLYDGLIRTYWYGGRLLTSYTYVHGTKCGPFAEYRGANYSVSESGNYDSNGLLHGLYKLYAYTQGGCSVTICTYTHGQLDSGSCATTPITCP